MDCTQPSSPLTITTQRLTLRPLNESDLATTYEYASNPANTQYMLYLPSKTIDDTKNFLQRVSSEWQKEIPSYYEFAVTLDNHHIGAVSIYLNDSRTEAELGWIINLKYQGRGYATEAAKAVMQYSLDALKVNRIVAHCDYRNDASANVMRKIGMTLERSDGFRRYRDTEEDIPELMYSLNVK